VSTPILQVEHLAVSYGRVEAVHDVSFEAAEGSLITLVGANGAGKTSVINAVSGILRPSAGTIRFDGQDITRTPSHRLVKQGLVQVPEGARCWAP
jgi:branched-chain amino acid transport system ATP-binding protein